ncbi:hypothetical protein BH20ACI2_BH20ACI2_00750 [soil metagenome]
METPHLKLTLNELPIGSRLIVRSRTDWRFAAISKISEERVVLTVCSPSGRTYRPLREIDTEIFIEGAVPSLVYDEPDDWRENLSGYDLRW